MACTTQNIFCFTFMVFSVQQLKWQSIHSYQHVWHPQFFKFRLRSTMWVCLMYKKLGKKNTTVAVETNFGSPRSKRDFKWKCYFAFYIIKYILQIQVHEFLNCYRKFKFSGNKVSLGQFIVIDTLFIYVVFTKQLFFFTFTKYCNCSWCLDSTVL